jgi:hypothetical protein
MTQPTQREPTSPRSPFASVQQSLGSLGASGVAISPARPALNATPSAVGGQNPLAGVGSGLLAMANPAAKAKNENAQRELRQGGQALKTPAQGSGQGSGQGGIDWTDGRDPDMSRSRKSEEEGGYNIQSIADPKTGKIVITSNNIRMEVAPMSAEFDRMFAGKNDAQIQQMIDGWQSKKNADDGLAYGNLQRAGGQGNVRGTEDLRQLAHDNGYYGSEQHMVWATAASARTGGRVPPEFFMDFDPFGGTAGNGPNVEQGGRAGEPMSTISMAHDTDWSLGRYMNVGPLNALHGINPTEQYQMKRMGMAGLFNGSEALAFNPARIVNPLDAADRQRGQTDDQIFRALNGAAGRDVLYRGWSPNVLGDENYKLNRGLDDWSVQYAPDYLRNERGPTDDRTAFTEDEMFMGAGVKGNAVGWLNQHYAPGR